MVRSTVLLGVFGTLCVSQAFFLAPATTARCSSSTTCGAIGSDWTCQHNWRRERSTAGARRERRGAGGALTMKKKVKNHLEEVSGELASKPVTLKCPAGGGTLVCYAERIAVVRGKRYLVAFPKDPAVAIAFDENGEVSPVPNDDPIMEQLFPLAAACVADLGPDVTLLRTPTTLTVKGLDELVEAKDKEDEDGGGSYDEDEEADEVELLGEFLLEGEEFLVVRFLEPILILAKEHAPGQYVLIDEDEEQDAIPLVDEMLCTDPSIK